MKGDYELILTTEDGTYFEVQGRTARNCLSVLGSAIQIITEVVKREEKEKA